MLETLEQFLLEKGYVKVKLHLTKTNHLEINASINGKQGLFILDTGNSNDFVGFDTVETFKQNVEDTDIIAAGAGALDMETKKSSKTKIKIGKWKNNNTVLV